MANDTQCGKSAISTTLHSQTAALSLASLVLNLPLFLVVLRYSALRSKKEYCIICGLALADTLRACTVFSTAIQRLYLLFTETHCSECTALSCFIFPHLEFKYTATVTNCMLLAVSFDRLYAVARPVKYFQARQAYAMKLVGCAFGVAGVVGLLGVVDMFPQRGNTLSCMCPAKFVFTKKYLNPFKLIVIFGSTSSCVLYMFVPLAYKKYTMKTVNPSSTKGSDGKFEEFKKVQKKLIVTFGLSSLCTLFLESIPKVLAHYFMNLLKQSPMFGNDFGRIFTTLHNINPILNFVFYVTRHAEMAFALKNMFRNKDLPLALESWQINS